MAPRVPYTPTGPVASLIGRPAVQILFDSTQIVKSDTFGFGIDEADYDLLAAEAAALDALCNGHFLG
jgi:hypothetical protein